MVSSRLLWVLAEAVVVHWRRLCCRLYRISDLFNAQQDQHYITHERSYSEHTITSWVV